MTSAQLIFSFWLLRLLPKPADPYPPNTSALGPGLLWQLGLGEEAGEGQAQGSSLGQCE